MTTPIPLQPLIASKNLGDIPRPASAVANLGLPTTTTTWTALSLVNSWANVGGGNAPAQVTKTLNMVTLEGVVVNGTAAQISTVPSGFLPGHPITLPCIYFTSPNFIVGLLILTAAGVLDVTTLAGATIPAGSNVYFTAVFPVA